MTKTLKQTAQAGFTLVELAIVLVIIGLIVGGVLVGQDLIKAAEIRATMSDIESYNAAATTFRNKYAGLPGDLASTRATQYGLADRPGVAGQGDGNSVVEGCASGATALGCETAVFWNDLTRAQLISQAFDGAASSGDTTVDNQSAVQLENYIPSTPVRETSKITLFPQAGRNYFLVGNMTTGASGAITLTDPPTAPGGLTPAEAAQIDDKIDDGLPLTGIVKAVSALTATAGATPEAAAAAADGICVANDSGSSFYSVATDNFATQLSCHIAVRASF